MNTAKYQAVLFDLDGTLLDTAPDFITAIDRLLRSKGLPASDPGKTRQMVTHGSAGIVANAFGMDTGHPEFEALRNEFLGLYLDNLADRTQPFPGIEAVLTKLDDQGTPWGIVTNKPALYTLAILEQLPLPSSPATVVCPDHVIRTKPDPESVYLACNELKVAPERCLCIGDHPRDIQAGLNAGTQTIAAAYGYLDDDEDPATWGAHHIVNDASEIQQHIFE